MQLTGTDLCVELKRAGVGCAVYIYWFVFGFEESRLVACS